MKRAFTIIEIMIALIIFWAWLLAILVVLNKNILLAKKIELKTTATLLSKEWIEIVFNKRDSNNIKYLQWNYITWDITNNSAQIEYFETWTAYKVWTDLTWYKNYIEKISSTPYILYSKLYLKTWEVLDEAWQLLYSWFYYNYKTWQKTPFSRYVIFTWVYLKPEEKVVNEDILKINSIVKYNWWWTTWEVNLESFITNWK